MTMEMREGGDVSSSDDDFVLDGTRNRMAHLPGGDQLAFDNLMRNAQQGVSSIRHSLKRKKSTKQKRGPPRIKVCLLYYLLPEASMIPKFSKGDPLIDTHHSANYGYPSKAKKRVSCDEGLGEEEYQDFLHGLYPHIDQSVRFQVCKMTKSKQLEEVHPCVPASLYKFKGTVVLTLKPREVQQQRRQQPQQSVATDTPRNIPERLFASRTEDSVTATRPPTPHTPQLTQPQTQPRRQRSEPTTPRNITERQEFPTGTPTVTFGLPTEDNLEAVWFATESIDVIRGDDNNQSADVEIISAGWEDVPPIEETVIAEQVHQQPSSVASTSLRIQQDIQYAESLTLDSEMVVERQQAVIRRRLNRQERARRRQQNNQQFKESDDDDDADDDEQSSDDDLNSTTEDQPDEFSRLKIQSITDLLSRAANVKEALLPKKMITLQRCQVFEGLLDAYMLDKTLVHHHVQFHLEGEEALDANGVTREVFTIFFQKLMDKLEGDVEKVPSLDHRLLFNSFYEIIGNIISHSFVLVGYFPPRLCRATATAMICGEVSNSLLLESFKCYISGAERQALHSASEDYSDPTMRLRLLALLSRLDCREMPKNQTDVERIVVSVARTVLVCKPLFCTARMASGLHCYPLLWQDVNPSVLEELFASMKPTPASILQLIRYEPTPTSGVDSVLMSVLEERVKGYLEEYIVSLSDERLIRLLQFWTAADMVVVPSLHVSFNSLEGSLMRPIANTCIAQLQLSRSYVSRQEFFDNMTSYLSCEQAQRFDSI